MHGHLNVKSVNEWTNERTNEKSVWWKDTEYEWVSDVEEDDEVAEIDGRRIKYFLRQKTEGKRKVEKI